MDEEIEKSRQEISSRGGAREGAGKPPFVPTDEERAYVEKLSGIGLVQEQIAALIRDGIHSDTLRDHFGKELLAGKAKANAAIGGLKPK